jgi:hypothetical protein
MAMTMMNSPIDALTGQLTATWPSDEPQNIAASDDVRGYHGGGDE